MTADELRAARNQLGVSGAEFARAFDVSERTLRSWEGAIRNKRLIPVPRTGCNPDQALRLKNPLHPPRARTRKSQRWLRPAIPTSLAA